MLQLGRIIKNIAFPINSYKTYSGILSWRRAGTGLQEGLDSVGSWVSSPFGS
jgi:hypothetical protein